MRLGVALGVRHPQRSNIDHDHSLGLNAVRGAVCVQCNADLRNVDAGSSEPSAQDLAYLASAWHRHRPLVFTVDRRTTVRNVRVDDALWDAAMDIARTQRETITAVARRYLVEYIKVNGGNVPVGAPKSRD